MTKEEFIKSCMSLVPVDEPNRHVFEWDAGRMFDAGWSLADARAMFLAHEEVNPDLPEEIALERMFWLQWKYLSPKERLEAEEARRQHHANAGTVPPQRKR